jgi:hypothetical protein
VLVIQNVLGGGGRIFGHVELDEFAPPEAINYRGCLLKDKANSSSMPKYGKLLKNFRSKFTKELSRSASIPKQYEEKLYWIYKQQVSGIPLESYHTSYIDLGEGRKKDFADCVETSMRNFIKIIIDEDLELELEKEYNIDLLRTLGADKKVIDFFEKFPTREKQKTQEAHDTWGQTLAFRSDEGIEYTHIDTYEIKTPSTNVLTLMNLLLFPKEDPLTTWSELGRKINEKLPEKIKFEVLSEGDETLATTQDQKTGVITIDSSISGKYKWTFGQHHDLEAVRKNPLDGPPEDIQEFNTSKIKDKKANLEHIKSHIYALYPSSEAKRDYLLESKDPNKYLYTFYNDKPLIKLFHLKSSHLLSDPTDDKAVRYYLENTIKRLGSLQDKTNLLKRSLSELWSKAKQ